MKERLKKIPKDGCRKKEEKIINSGEKIKIQLIVATHSPFMLTDCLSENVLKLRREDNFGKVFVDTRESSQNNFPKFCEYVKKYIDANYFDDSLIPIPLSNYFEYQNDVSFLKMTMKQLGSISSDLEKSKKLKWSPHFIYYEEVMLLVFYQRHIKRKTQDKFSYVSEFVSNLYGKVNFIDSVAPIIGIEDKSSIAGYELKEILVPSKGLFDNRIDIGVASVKYDIDKANPTDRWKPLTYEAKQSFNNVLKGMFQYCNRHDTKILVMPELYMLILMNTSSKGSLAKKRRLLFGERP